MWCLVVYILCNEILLGAIGQRKMNSGRQNTVTHPASLEAGLQNIIVTKGGLDGTIGGLRRLEVCVTVL